VSVPVDDSYTKADRRTHREIGRHAKKDIQTNRLRVLRSVMHNIAYALNQK